MVAQRARHHLLRAAAAATAAPRQLDVTVVEGGILRARSEDGPLAWPFGPICTADITGTLTARAVREER
jgi:hypothetical protein